MQVPGGSQVLMGFALTLLATFFLATAKISPKEGTPKNAKNPEFVRTIFDVFGVTKGLLLLAVPVVIAGVAVAASLRRERRRVWFGSAVALALLVVGARATFYVFPAGLIGYGVYRAYKVEGPSQSSFGSRRRRAATASADERDDVAADAGDDPDPDVGDRSA